MPQPVPVPPMEVLGEVPRQAEDRHLHPVSASENGGVLNPDDRLEPAVNPFQDHHTDVEPIEGEARVGKVRIPWRAYSPEERVDGVKTVASRGWTSLLAQLDPFCRAVAERGKPIVNVGDPYIPVSIGALGINLTAKRQPINLKDKLGPRVEAMLAVNEDTKDLGVPGTSDFWGESMSGVVAVRAAESLIDDQESDENKNLPVRSLSLFVPAGLDGHNALQVLASRLPFESFEAIRAAIENREIADVRTLGEYAINLLTNGLAIALEGIETGNADTADEIIKLRDQGVPVGVIAAYRDPIFHLEDVKKHSSKAGVPLIVSRFTGHLILHKDPKGAADEALHIHNELLKSLRPPLAAVA